MINWLRSVFPICLSDDPASSQSPEVLTLRDKLADHLGSLRPFEIEIADRVLPVAVTQGLTQGIFFQLDGQSEPALSFLVGKLASSGQATRDSQLWAQEIQSAICRLSRDNKNDLYSLAPAIWEQNPLVYWVKRYSESLLFPRAIGYLHNRVLLKILSGLKRYNDHFSAVSATWRKTYIFLEYARQASRQDVANLTSEASASELGTLLLPLLYRNPPPDKNGTGTPLRTYESGIRSFTGMAPSRGWKYKGGKNGLDRRSFEREHTDILSQDDYEDLDSKNKVRRRFVKKARENDKDLIDVIKQGSAGGDEDEPKKERSRTGKKSEDENVAPKYFHDEWLATLFINITQYTIGVLSPIEIAILLRSTYELEASGNVKRAQAARAVLLFGIGLGWGKSNFINAVVIDSAPDLWQVTGCGVFSDGQFVWLRPEATVGCPKGLNTSEVTSETYLRNKLDHDRFFEEIIPAYKIPLHPALSSVTKPLLLNSKLGGPLLTESEYQQALKDLTSGLSNHIPFGGSVTSGQMYLTFLGQSNAYGLDGIDQYVISGRARNNIEMGLNYTRASVRESVERDWSFIDHLMGEVRSQYNYEKKGWGWPDLPESFASTDGIPSALASQCDVFTGSWSIPKLDLAREVFQFVRQQAQSNHRSAYEQANWQVLDGVLSTWTLTCARPFDINTLFLPPGYRRKPESFVQATKKKKEDEMITTVYRHVPLVIRARWWNAIGLCTRDYKSGPVLCLWDDEGKRKPLILQKQLNFILEEMGEHDQYIRAYGISRHLGRTLFRDYGMPEVMLTFKSNHSGIGYEKYNPILNMCLGDFKNVDNNVGYKVAAYLKIIGES